MTGGGTRSGRRRDAVLSTDSRGSDIEARVDASTVGGDGSMPRGGARKKGRDGWADGGIDECRQWTGEGSRWMLRYCRPRPLRPLPPFPHLGACRRGSLEIHRLHPAPTTGRPGQKGGVTGFRRGSRTLLWITPTQRSSAPRGDEGSASRGCPEPRSPAPQDLDTAGTVESLEPLECGIPTDSSQHRGMENFTLFIAIDLKGKKISNTEERNLEVPSAVTRPSPRAPRITDYSVHILQNAQQFIHPNLSAIHLPMPRPCHSTRTTAGLMQ